MAAPSAPRPSAMPVAPSDPGRGSPRVLLHGFTQNGRCWGPFADRLAERHRCRLLDLPGHGAGGPASGGPGSAAEAAVAAGGRGTYIGYSMGGRIALHAALAHPGQVERLVLIGAHPGIDDPEAREERAAQDDRRADRIEEIGLASFLEEWLAGPLFADLDPATAQVEARLTNDAARVAGALRAYGTGRQEPLWSRLGEIDQPTLVVVGARDPRYLDVGRRTVEAIGANASMTEIRDAGHAAHLSNPVAAAEAVDAWLG